MTTREKFYENLTKFNYKMVDPNQEIKNIREKILLEFEGQQYETVFRNFADGYLPHKNNSNKIKDIETFKKMVFDLVGDEFEVLEGEVYINNKKPIKMRHKICGRIIDTLCANTFLSGKRCKYCGGHYTPTLEEVKKMIKEKDNNYEIADDLSYKSLSKDKTKLIHKTCGNIYEVQLDNFLKGQKCPNCSHGSILKTQKEFERDVELYGRGEFKVLSEYIDCKTKVRIQHTKCGCIEEIRPFDFLYNRKNKCLNCKISRESIEENEVREFIKTLGYSPKKIKKKIDGSWYELDIFVEELKIGFEFNGTYWHSEGISKNKLNIFNKMNAYKSIGIRVVSIFEDEWLFKNNIVKNKIANILKRSSLNKIYARKCDVRDISSSEKNDFLNDNHIQGEDKCNISKGLFYNNELIAVMTFSKLRNSLGNKKKESTKYELSRYATKYNIPGGFSKLFKHILNENKNIKTIITYADLRWSDFNSNIYASNGFILNHQSKPNYWYNDGRKRYHRYNFRKQVLKEKFPEFYDDKLTEHQIMDKTNYRRIWDCGNLVYEWKRKDD